MTPTDELGHEVEKRVLHGVELAAQAVMVVHFGGSLDEVVDEWPRGIRYSGVKPERLRGAATYAQVRFRQGQRAAWQTVSPSREALATAMETLWPAVQQVAVRYLNAGAVTHDDVADALGVGHG